MQADIATVAFTVKDVRDLAERARSLRHSELWLIRRKDGCSFCLPDLTDCVAADAVEPHLAVILLPLQNIDLVDTVSLRGFIIKQMREVDSSWRLLIQFNPDNEFRMLLRARWAAGEEDVPVVRRPKASRPASAWFDMARLLRG